MDEELVKGAEGRVPTVWIDTNVIVEVYSHADLLRAFQQQNTAAVEERRLKLQGSFWMAMAMASRAVVSVNFADEGVNTMLALAPPGTEVGAWTSMIIYVLGDGGVFDGWERRAHTSRSVRLPAPRAFVAPSRARVTAPQPPAPFTSSPAPVAASPLVIAAPPPSPQDRSIQGSPTQWSASDEAFFGAGDALEQGVREDRCDDFSDLDDGATNAARPSFLSRLLGRR